MVAVLEQTFPQHTPHHQHFLALDIRRIGHKSLQKNLKKATTFNSSPSVGLATLKVKKNKKLYY